MPNLTATQQQVLAFIRERPHLKRVEVVRALADARGVAFTTAQAAYDRLIAKGFIGPATGHLTAALRDVGRFLAKIQVATEHQAEWMRLRERILEAGG
jgi:DNA-binding transcriptional MocR family regulator